MVELSGFGFVLIFDGGVAVSLLLMMSTVMAELIGFSSLSSFAFSSTNIEVGMFADFLNALRIMRTLSNVLSTATNRGLSW